MKNTILFSLIFGLTSCLKDFEINLRFPTCDSPTRTVTALTVDYYSKKAIPNIKIQVYENALSLWGPFLIHELTTDTYGILDNTFEHSPTALSYSFKVLPNADTSYIYPWGALIFEGYECEKNWLIMMKPTQSLSLVVKNNGTTALGQIRIYVHRDGPANTIAYKNQDIGGPYSFGEIKIDSLPVGFEKNYKVKVVPEEQIQISCYDSSHLLKKVEFFTDKSADGHYTITF